MSVTFHERAKEVIRSIPRGKVATYGQVAACAGNPRGARQVVWALNSCPEKDGLPWHRVVNRLGRISLKPGQGFELQRKLLEQEGVKFDNNDTIDLNRFLWSPSA